jgi:hypothetical protein
MQGVRRARATGTRVILRAGVSDDLKVVRRLDHEAARWGIGYVPIGQVDCVLTVFRLGPDARRQVHGLFPLQDLADYGIGHGHATALVGYVLAQRAAGGTEGPPGGRSSLGCSARSTA